MALTKPLTFSDGTRSEKAYLRVSLEGTAKALNLRVLAFYDEESANAGYPHKDSFFVTQYAQGEEATPAIVYDQEKPVFPQAYKYLKTVSGFTDAVDC